MKLLRVLEPSVLLTVLSAAQFVPMTIWASNAAEIGFPDGLILWSALVAVVGLLVWIGLVVAGTDPRGSTYVVFWGILGASTIGVRADNTPGGALILLIGILIYCLAIYRIRDLGGFQWFHFWAVASVAIAPIGFVFASTLTSNPVSIASAAIADDLEFQEHPDVVLAVFDAHASLEVLEERFGVDVSTEYRPWLAEGARIVSGMRANYSLSHLSLASVLDMTYPYYGGDRIGDSEWKALLGAISGENALISAFKELGYRYTIVESGWPGVHCTRFADSCARGAWPDEATLQAVERSLARSWLRPVFRDAGPQGAILTIDWIDSDLESMLSNDTRDLILLHLLLPHPPLRLNRECLYKHELGLGGRTVASPSLTDAEIEKRVGAYIEATKCARDVITKLLRTLGDEGVLVAFGDHGPDSQAQLQTLPDEWSEAQFEERFGALFVTNSECPLADFRSLVNLGPWLVGCLSHQPVQFHRDRFFIAIGSRRNIEADSEPILEVTSQVGVGGAEQWLGE